MSDTSKVMACTCEHAFQDERYGKGMRVHTLTARIANEKANQGDKVAKCTVCGR